MTRIIIEDIVWDNYNENHIKKHFVEKEEVEEASNNILYHKKTYNGRYLVVGRSARRLISFVVRKIESKTYYLVTARDAATKERKKAYEKEKQNT